MTSAKSSASWAPSPPRRQPSTATHSSMKPAAPLADAPHILASGKDSRASSRQSRSSLSRGPPHPPRNINPHTPPRQQQHPPKSPHPRPSPRSHSQNPPRQLPKSSPKT